MNSKEIYMLVENFLGYKIKMLYLNSETNEVGGIMYDSFLIKCLCDNKKNTFQVGINYGNSSQILSTLLGENCICIINEKEIKKKLQVVDDYCRLRLPDRFLDAYYKAYVLSQYEDCDI